MFFTTLFRSSRPDYIETYLGPRFTHELLKNCSGLPDRTTLRLPPSEQRVWQVEGGLFRSSRPDYIETGHPAKQIQTPAHR